MGVGCVNVHCLLVLILATPCGSNVSIDKEGIKEELRISKIHSGSGAMD